MIPLRGRREKHVFNRLVTYLPLRGEEGVDLVEYALLLGFVALASIGALTTLSGDISALWTSIATKLSSTS